jgi:two-component system response regulator YesN
MPINGNYTPYDLERVKEAIAYIHSHYTDNISPDQLAIEVNLSIKLLQVLMQVATGMTVHQYLTKVRVDRATRDLSDYTKSIKLIAPTHGFSSPSHFCREFKKQFGITTTEYRVQLLHTEEHLR